jgi:hypothetical protein
MFALCAAALLGMVGLATEVGTWYVARTQAYSVADAVAVAGAVQGAWTSTQGYDPATDPVLLTPLSGYTSASVQATPIAWPPPTPKNPNPPQTATATQASVNVPLPSFIALLFTSQSVMVGATATAVVLPTGSDPTSSAPTGINVACALSLSGTLTITQSQDGWSSGFPCFYASNFNGPQAINVAPPAIQAQGLTTVGGCSDTCPAADPTSPLVGGSNSDGNFLARPTATLQPPTTNPYAVVDGEIIVQAGQIICPDPASGTITYPPGTVLNPSTNCPPSPTAATVTALVPSGGDAAIGQNPNPAQSCPPKSGFPAIGSVCGYHNVQVTISSDVTIYPGTYLFVDSSLTIQSGTVQCMAYSNANVGPCDPNVALAEGVPSYSVLGMTGVAFVFTGDSPGNLVVCGSAAFGRCPGGTGASVTLSAQATNGFSPALNGVLFYRSSTSPSPDGSANAPVVYIDDSGNTLLEGGMYFPNAYVSFTANTGSIFPVSCAIVVAGVLTLGYPSSASSLPVATTQFSEGGCGLFGTPTPFVQTVQLVR